MTAVIGARDFQWLDGLRRRHFPPERNQLPAHLTLFHHLPPSAREELRRLIMVETIDPAPQARLSGVVLLGNGVACAIESSGLRAIRERLAEAFSGQLTPQDEAGWRPHITIQNKAAPDAARALLRELRANFQSGPLMIEGLAAHYYRGGPWEPIFERRFERR